MVMVIHGAEPLALLYRRVEPPAAGVVDLARACRHLRMDEVDLDEVEADLVEAAIAAAVEHLDGRTGILGRALLTQTWQATTDRPTWSVLGRGSAPGFLLELPEVQDVTRVECMVDGEYVELAPANWRVVARPGGRIAVTSHAWPATDRDPEAWRITFRAGYGDAGEAVPAPIRSAILLMVADLYDTRDGKVQSSLVENPTVDRLLAPYRVRSV